MSTPQDRKKAFEELTKRKQQMIDAEKKRREDRLESIEEQKEKEEKYYLEIVEKDRQARVEKEEWRQEQHRKRDEAERDKKRKEEELQHEKELEQKKKEEQEKRMENLAHLHELAVKKRVEENIELLQNEEHETVKKVDHREEVDLSDIEDSMKRALEHITKEIDKKKHAAEMEMQRKLDSLPKPDMKLSEEERRGVMSKQRKTELALKADLEKALFDIQHEGNKLKEEVRQREGNRRAKVQRQAERKRAEAKAQKEAKERWEKKYLEPYEKSDDIMDR